jgi:hypothetical protein
VLSFDQEIRLERCRRERSFAAIGETNVLSTAHYVAYDSHPTPGEMSLKKARQANAPRADHRLAISTKQIYRRNGLQRPIASPYHAHPMQHPQFMLARAAASDPGNSPRSVLSEVGDSGIMSSPGEHLDGADILLPPHQPPPSLLVTPDTPILEHPGEVEESGEHLHVRHAAKHAMWAPAESVVVLEQEEEEEAEEIDQPLVENVMNGHATVIDNNLENTDVVQDAVLQYSELNACEQDEGGTVQSVDTSAHTDSGHVSGDGETVNGHATKTDNANPARSKLGDERPRSDSGVRKTGNRANSDSSNEQAFGAVRVGSVTQVYHAEKIQLPEMQEDVEMVVSITPVHNARAQPSVEMKSHADTVGRVESKLNDKPQQNGDHSTDANGDYSARKSSSSCSSVSDAINARDLVEHGQLKDESKNEVEGRTEHAVQNETTVPNSQLNHSSSENSNRKKAEGLGTKESQNGLEAKTLDENKEKNAIEDDASSDSVSGLDTAKQPADSEKGVTFITTTNVESTEFQNMVQV